MIPQCPPTAHLHRNHLELVSAISLVEGRGPLQVPGCLRGAVTPGVASGGLQVSQAGQRGGLVVLGGAVVLHVARHQAGQGPGRAGGAGSRVVMSLTESIFLTADYCILTLFQY